MVEWHDEVFLEEIHAWIRSAVVVTGPIEQPHVEAWSTVLRAPTLDGWVWCKASAEGSSYEVRLTALLAGLRPHDVPEIIAVDGERGWMLMRDGGVRLRERGDELEAWRTVLPAYAELQLATAPHVERLVGIGVPDERLEGLPIRLRALLDDDQYLMLGEPDGLTIAERERLVAMLPEIGSICRELAGAGLPATIQHDDLHGGAVLVRDDRYRVFDWGDACVSHPFHSLTVLLRATAWKLGLEPGGAELIGMRDAYLEAFEGFGSRDELVLVAGIAYRTGTLARALAWQRYLSGLPPQERSEELDTVAYGLQRFLENGPLGAWRW
jgi:hypothetical protein